MPAVSYARLFSLNVRCNSFVDPSFRIVSFFFVILFIFGALILEQKVPDVSHCIRLRAVIKVPDAHFLLKLVRRLLCSLGRWWSCSV